jgi:hypothetical protein
MNQREWDRAHGIPWRPCPTCGGTGKCVSPMSGKEYRCVVCIGPCWPSQTPMDVTEKDRL